MSQLFSFFSSFTFNTRCLSPALSANQNKNSFICFFYLVTNSVSLTPVSQTHRCSLFTLSCKWTFQHWQLKRVRTLAHVWLLIFSVDMANSWLIIVFQMVPLYLWVATMKKERRLLSRNMKTWEDGGAPWWMTAGQRTEHGFAGEMRCEINKRQMSLFQSVLHTWTENQPLWLINFRSNEQGPKKLSCTVALSSPLHQTDWFSLPVCTSDLLRLKSFISLSPLEFPPLPINRISNWPVIPSSVTHKALHK